MAMAYVIWLEMSGSGARIGMIQDIMRNPLNRIQRDQVQVEVMLCVAGRGDLQSTTYALQPVSSVTIQPLTSHSTVSDFVVPSKIPDALTMWAL